MTMRCFSAAWRLGLAALLSSLAGCADGATIVVLDPPLPPDPGGPADPEPDEPAPPPDARATRDASWVFDEVGVRSYELELEPADWEALKASALAEAYFPAHLSVEGAAFGEVGLRFKGNRGSLGRCANGAG